MKNKRIAVLLKFFGGEIGGCDEAALEWALRCENAEVVALTMAPPSCAERASALTRLGVRVVCISDKVYAGADTLATARVLAQAVRRLSPDLVFCGVRSSDGDTGQVPPMLAQMTGASFYGAVIETDGERATDGSGTSFALARGGVLAFPRGVSLRFPSAFARGGRAELWDNALLGLDSAVCGLRGSPTRVIKAYESAAGRRKCRFAELSRLKTLIAQSLEKERVGHAAAGGEKLKRVYYAGDIAAQAEAVAERAVRLDIADKSPEAIAEEIKNSGAETVLWSGDAEIKHTAARVAVLLGAGLCADCTALRAENGKLVMTRPAREGNITADIVCTGKISMATLRTATAGSDLIFAVGRGALRAFDKIKKLAEELGAELCCSRPAADAGILPHTAQVGLTGKSVRPRVYVAFGISGAVQHTCAIEGADTVIAVNADRRARIFEYADYGIVAQL